MADITFATDHQPAGRSAASLPRRIMAVFGFSFAELGAAIAEARKELWLNQDLRLVDHRQLRDLGLDRNAC